MKIRFRLSMGLLATTVGVGVLGCASHAVVRDGFTVDSYHRKTAETQILNRAAFEMKCDASALTLRLINVHPWFHYPQQIGVTGCGQRAIYTRMPMSGTWVLDSTASSEARTATAQSR